MAKSSKTKSGKSKTDTSVNETVDVTQSVEDTPVEEVTEVLEAEIEESHDIPDDEDGLDMDDHSDLEMEIVDEPIVTVPEEIAAAEPVHSNSSAGFLPLLLGGVAAGAIGYGIATYYPMNGGSDDLTQTLAAQADQIAALEAQIAQVPDIDLSGVESQIAGLSEQTVAQIGDVSANLDAGLSALDERLLEVEKRPSGDGTLSDTALAAYQRELEDLRAELDAQQETVMSAAAQAEADLAAAREEAAQLEADAIASAEAAAGRAALNRVAAAVETGAPFVDAISDLPGADIPEALTRAAETGVSTTAQLTADFPAAARAALGTARAEGLSEDAGGVGGFLLSQFDVRSTSPQEGPGPDAVLSRAEAAVKEGRVADALAELEALPEVVRAELTDWTAQATERADVLDAIATLSETYN